MTTASGKPGGDAAPREWQPHIWEGCDFFAWARLLVRNHFAIGWRYLYIAAVVSVVSIFHTLLRWLQRRTGIFSAARLPDLTEYWVEPAVAWARSRAACWDAVVSSSGPPTACIGVSVTAPPPAGRAAKPSAPPAAA